MPIPHMSHTRVTGKDTNFSQTTASFSPNIASQTILHAEAHYLVGRFKVYISQIKPHPYQRSLSPDWVDSLHNHFLDVGIDRAAHPVKVVLENDDMCPVVPEPANGASWLPESINVLVYDGQHRIEACKKLDDEKHRWWFAEVYRRELESVHPAELLTIMHTSNEEHYKLETNDYDRFNVMYHMQKLHIHGKITPDVYRANIDRLTRSVAKEGTRHGLLSLLRSTELCKAVSGALEYPALRPCFNAGTWGKKLTKGRFYRLSACLIDEMVEQCLLLQDGLPEVSSRPFQLTPQSCSLKILSSAVNKKAHPWNELSGGPVAALARVSRRPENFLTLLNPRSSDGWTFPDTVLLPSVLTSDVVGRALNEMYLIAQHFIHMIAGIKCLERYTTSSPNISQDGHPTGVISLILKDKLGGKSSNYPDKIIHTMWTTRFDLLHSLEQCRMNQPSLATKTDYQILISQSEHWWSLLRLLKIPLLDQGLGLTIPVVFGSPMPLLRSNNDFQATIVRRPPGTQPRQQARDSEAEVDQSHSMHSIGSQPKRPNETLPWPESSSSNGHSTRNDTGKRGSTSSKKEGTGATLPAGETTPSSDDDEEQEEQEEQGRSGGQQGVLDLNGEDLQRRSASINLESDAGSHDRVQNSPRQHHDNVAQRLRQLGKDVAQMSPDEAHALDQLIQLIGSLQGTTYMVRVVDALVRKTKLMKKKVLRANQAMEAFEMDEDSQPEVDQELAGAMHLD